MIEAIATNNQLAAMIGATNFARNGDNQESFHFKGCRLANMVQLTCASDDTITMEFFKYNKKTFDFASAGKTKELHISQLRSEFGNATRLRVGI
jgi:hypothetical protein